MRVCIVVNLIFYLIFANNISSADVSEEILSLTKEINRFEKEVPFFTKSKILVILKCDNTSFNDAFYGVYINENLVKTGQITPKTFPLNKDIYVGDYPVHAGNNLLKLRIYKDGMDIQKKFQVEVPEYRRIAVQLYITDTPQKARVITQAWVIE